MPTAAAAMAGGSILGSVIQARGAKAAGRAQARAADRAAQLQAQQFQMSKELLQPFVLGAAGAFERQQALTGALGPEAQNQAYQQFQESPGVQWQRDQGLRGIEAELGSQGVGGGTRLKAITEYNQQLAMQDFANQFNRLGAVTGVGLNAASALTGAGANATAGQAAALQVGGAARAGAALGRAGAFASGVQNLGNIYTMQKMGVFNSPN